MFKDLFERKGEKLQCLKTTPEGAIAVRIRFGDG